MKAATERKIMRWVHIVISIPIVGFIYGPVSEMYYPALSVKFVFFPALVLSGLWMWKGHIVRHRFMRINRKDREYRGPA